MKCPHVPGTSEQANDHKYEYDEYGRLARETHILIEKRIWPDCLKEGCAAWFEGRCTYGDK